MTSFPFDLSRLLAASAGVAVPMLVVGRVALAVAIVLAALCLFLLPDRAEHWRRTFGGLKSPLGVAILVTFVLWLPNLFASIDPLRSFEASARVFLIIGLLTALGSVLASERRLLDICLKALIIMTAVATVMAVLSLTVAPEIFWVTHLKGWRSNPANHGVKPFAALTVLLIPMLLWAGQRMGARWLAVAVVSNIGLLAVVWLTYNRAAIAGMIAALIVCGALIAWAERRTSVTVIFAVVVGAAVTAVVVWLKATRGIFCKIPWNSYTGLEPYLPVWLIDYERQMTWEFSLGLMHGSPWIGLGINTINFQPGADAQIPNTLDLPMISGHPHNWIVEVLAETGVIGFIPLVVVIFMMFYQFALHYARDRNPAMLAAAATAAGYWGSGLFNFSFWSVWWQTAFVLMMVICWAAASEQRSGANSNPDGNDLLM